MKILTVPTPGLRNLRVTVPALVAGLALACAPVSPEPSDSGEQAALPSDGGDASGGEQPLPDGGTAPEPLADGGAPLPGPDAGAEPTLDAGEPPPTCGALGGNTCVAPPSTLCDTLPLLPAADCAVCCARPPDHPLFPAGFHVLHRDFPDAWNDILALSLVHLGQLLASQRKPTQVGTDRWAQVITSEYGWRDDGTLVSFANGQQMAAFIHERLALGTGGPARVMVDELRANSKERLHECAVELATRYPQWAGRWGVFVVHGKAVSYAALNTAPTPAVDALLDAHATFSVELYPARADYCAAGTTAAERDTWLEDFFRGGQGAFPQERFHWLAQRRTARGSSSQLSLLFGVTDTYLTGTHPGIFLDRMFYVWRARSGYPSLLLSGNGGPGAWKWHDQSPASRDALFRASFEWYVGAGNTSSRLGQVPCP
ncbi:MAG: hypothetical protein RL653_648 [Pseudomonadota bacterium]